MLLTVNKLISELNKLRELTTSVLSRETNIMSIGKVATIPIKLVFEMFNVDEVTFIADSCSKIADIDELVIIAFDKNIFNKELCWVI